MGKYLKNPDLSPGSLAARVPLVPSSAISDAPVDGLIRFNQSSSRIEFYYNGKWNQVAKIGTVQIVVDTIVPDGYSASWSSMIPAETDPTAIAVFIGGVYQLPNVNYTLGDSTPGIKSDPTSTIVFSSVPPANNGVMPNTITIIHNLNSTDAA